MRLLQSGLLSLLLLSVLFVPVIYAQEPTPAPGGGGITIEPEDLPYTFTPISYTTEGGPMSTQLNLFSNADFINLIGSVILTLFTLIDTQNVLAIFVVILLAAWILWRICKFTMTSQPSGDIDISDIDETRTGGFVEPVNDEYVLETRYSISPYGKNPYKKVYTRRFVKRR